MTVTTLPVDKVIHDSAVLAERTRRWTLALLCASFLVVLSHAFVPPDQFIHRGDDAFYYFKVAINYPIYGYWTFDGINPTNGVQPLWAMTLTAVAQFLAWFGVTDAELLSRIFVAIAGLCHCLSTVVLFTLLARVVSMGTAIVAAGAMVFSPGLVWARVWGMENSLYALVLLVTITYFHRTFRPRPRLGAAVVLGLLLGVTALSRLNAILFIPCLLGYFVLRKTEHRPSDRIRLAVVAGAVASWLIFPYLVVNQVTTGHLLPISGAVKAVETEDLLHANGVSSIWSGSFLNMLFEETQWSLRQFLKARVSDGLWVTGLRFVFDGAARVHVLAAVLAGLLLVPAIVVGVKQWAKCLVDRFQRLSQFSYVAIFALLNGLASLILYPGQVHYAMTRWWLVESEIVVIVVVATVAAAALSAIGARFVAPQFRPAIVAAFIVLALAWHSWQTARFHWGEQIVIRDWNASWNDESYRAAQWMSANLPSDVTVGSWNAGVLGYYSERSVVNLDGLINSYELLPYIEDHDIASYIDRERITYLSDMDGMFERTGVRERLRLTEVYSHYSPLMEQSYRIYRVDA